MRLYILHLSDIHISDESTLKSIHDRVVDAIRGVVSSPGHLVIAVTGDVAYSGKPEQYAIAAAFFEKLRTELREISDFLTVAIVVVPGNHDCDFTGDSKALNVLRTAALAEVEAIDDSISTPLLALQDHFFDFEGSLFVDGVTRGTGRLYYNRLIELDGRRIVFHCLDSAWMSRLHEKQAELVFPTSVLPADHVSADLSVGLFHHPYQWFEASNLRIVRSTLEQFCDLILTGHEHEQMIYERREKDKGATYLEGGVFAGESHQPSSFSLIEYVWPNNEYRHFQFVEQGSAYGVVDASPAPQQSTIGKSRAAGKPVVAAEFTTNLADPGAPYTHPFKKLTLDDIWVYPEVLDRSFGKTDSATYSAKEIIDPSADYPKVLIVG